MPGASLAVACARDGAEQLAFPHTPPPGRTFFVQPTSRYTARRPQAATSSPSDSPPSSRRSAESTSRCGTEWQQARGENRLCGDPDRYLPWAVMYSRADCQ